MMHTEPVRRIGRLLERSSAIAMSGCTPHWNQTCLICSRQSFSSTWPSSRCVVVCWDCVKLGQLLREKLLCACAHLVAACNQQSKLSSQGNHSHVHMDSVVKMKSLPFDASQLDIIQFFDSYKLKPNGVQLVVRSDNKPTGEVRSFRKRKFYGGESDGLV